MEPIRNRLPEAEIMADPSHAQAYAEGDFAQVNQEFIDRVIALFPKQAAGQVLDLGCGPADIPVRFAETVIEARITAVDASEAMLDIARQRISEAGLADRIHTIQSKIDQNFSKSISCFPGKVRKTQVEEIGFDLIISNSLLHHLPDPTVFWETAKSVGHKGTAVYIKDLLRPESEEKVDELVELYAGSDNPVLKQGFRDSLFASFTLDEIRLQLETAGLSYLFLAQVSDRHWEAFGKLKS